MKPVLFNRPDWAEDPRMLTERTRVRRRSSRGSYDPAVVHAILDEALVSHVGFVVEGQPYVIPTIHARIGDRLYFHGAVANRTLSALRDGLPTCVTATLVDGIVLARSAMHHSLNYRSVVVLGNASPVTDRDEARAVLKALVERVRPGRSALCRPPNEAELQVTSILGLTIAEASAKIRKGPPVDDSADYTLPYWAGVIPLRTVAGVPEPDPLLSPDIALPLESERAG
jgi:nitroimidazol reductase NimA-like FMN-containing flavoprotein (pyridoxamine 5'-phosphate oxidase superfamily)